MFHKGTTTIGHRQVDKFTQLTNYPLIRLFCLCVLARWFHSEMRG